MKGWLLVLVIYALIAAATTFGLLAPDFDLQDTLRESRAPGADAWFGTDHLGRDVFSLTLHGSRIALGVGVLAALLPILLGTLLGLLAGWKRGPCDAICIWLSAAVESIPAVLLILAIGFMLGPGYWTVVIAISVVTWVGVFRVVRAEVMRLKNNAHLAVARASGAGFPRIAGRHLVPNLMPLLVVQFSLRFVYAIKAEVILSFLGLGLIDHPSWGRMIAHSREDLLAGHWWSLAAATLAMFGLVLTIQALGDRLRDRLDPAPQTVS